jgi:2,3-bisphosphoglycerate-dependent phosphoglycerate mutase
MKEAEFAAHQIGKENLLIHSIYTSQLLRAVHTTKILTSVIDYPFSNVKYSWRLNERHYGSLQGLNKSETAAKYGEEQVLIWRRSFDIPPPLMKMDDKRHPRFNSKFDNIKDKDLPSGESLKMVIKRLSPFWEKYFNSIKDSKGTHIIVAHSNSLRAIVKIIDKLSNEEVLSLNIPTGVPLLYQFDNSYNVVDKRYLINKRALQQKQNNVKNQGKAK